MKTKLLLLMFLTTGCTVYSGCQTLQSSDGVRAVLEQTYTTTVDSAILLRQQKKLSDGDWASIKQIAKEAHLYLEFWYETEKAGVSRPDMEGRVRPLINRLQQYLLENQE